MKREFTNIRSLIGAFAKALNLINREMQHHHEQTAYLAYRIAVAMGLRGETLNLVLFSALMHDIGFEALQESATLKEIEAGRKQVAKLGTSMIREVEELHPVADIIEVVQNSYEENLELLKDDVRLDISQAVHLSDYVTSIFREDQPILDQVKGILSSVEALRDSEFSSKAIDALMDIGRIESLWLDIALNPEVLALYVGKIHRVRLEEVVVFTRFMSRIIDFRSPFTAMHSAGVAATARELARLAGMSSEEVKMMEIAGNLHDIGKLRVPNEILEKPGKLDEAEFNIMREHTYYTRTILASVVGFDKIADWAAFHHEKLNGKGYPFHLTGEQLDLGSRIMAVADIFSAITEERPYRAGMSREKALAVLKENVDRGEICGSVVKLLEEHFDEVDKIREQESREVGKRYFQSIEAKKYDEVEYFDNRKNYGSL